MRFRVWVVVMVLLATVGVRAQQDEISDYEELNLEELLDVVFTASKHRQSIFWSPSAASVYTRDDIRSSGATTLADFLRRVPGFDVYRLKSSYPLVGARSLTTASNNRVLLLVDGREAVAELSGFAFWDALTIDPEEIERIEVIRGPGSALYGANAFTAVVSITTVTDKPATVGDVLLYGGEYGREHLVGRARHSLGLGDGSLAFGAALGVEQMLSPSDPQEIALSHFRSHGYLRYRGGNRLDLSLHAGVILGEGIIYTQMGDLRYTDGDNHWFMGKSDVALSESIRLKGQVYYTRYAGNFDYRTDLRAYNIWIADVPIFDVAVYTIDGQVQLDWELNQDLLFICGGNLRYNTLDWTNAYVTEGDEWRAAGFVHLQWSPWDLLQLTGGVRLDWDTFTNDEHISPRVAAVFRPFEDHAFRLGYGLAFRRPSFFESRTHATVTNFNPIIPEIEDAIKTQFGNEELKSEKVHSVEAGWRGRFLQERLNLSVDLFYSIYRDNIIFVIDILTRLGGVPDINRSTFRYENSPEKITALGGEAEVSWRPAGDWLLWANLGLRKVTHKDSGDDVPSEPHLRFNLGGRYLPPAGLIADVALHYVSTYQMPQMDPANVLDNPDWFPLGDDFQLFARLGYRINCGETLDLETGLTFRTPLSGAFREYTGNPLPELLNADTASDFGGEVLNRLVTLYLRGSF